MIWGMISCDWEKKEELGVEAYPNTARAGTCSRLLKNKVFCKKSDSFYYGLLRWLMRKPGEYGGLLPDKVQPKDSSYVSKHA